MARLTKAEILSLTPQQIEQLKRHNLQQLKQITSDVQAINKKSYKRLSSKNIRSPFVTGYEKAGGTASLRGMTDKQVKAEFETQLALLKAQTRTKSGAQKVYSEMRKKINPSEDVLPEKVEDIPNEEISKFWDVYHKFSEIHPTESAKGTGGSPPEAVSEMIWNNMEGEKSIDDILSEVNQEYEEWYKQKELEEQADYISDPYSISGSNR